MKKQLLITPLLLLSLVACGNKGNGNNNTSADSKEDTQTTESNSNSESEHTSTGHSGLTASDAFTVEELISFMSNYSANQISDKEYYVTGVLGDSSYNSQYKQYTAYFQNHMKADSQPVQLYSAVLDASITGDYTAANVMAGATVVAKGYLELYVNQDGKKIYELPYLKADLSPNGKKYNPTIISITGGNQGGGSSTGGDTGGDTGDSSSGIAGKNASTTGTIPANAQTLSFDFTGGTIAGITATSSSKPQASGVATVNNYEFNFKNAIAHVASNYVETGYLGLCAKGASSVASFANKTAIPGKIVKIEVKMPKEKTSGSVSALAPIIVDFGTSALSSTSLTGGATGGSEATLSAYVAGINATYFAVSCVQGVSSKGEATWYNASIASITVTYVA